MFADFNGDGFEDFAVSQIGWPSESSGFGRVRIYNAGPAGLVEPSTEAWSQDSEGIKDKGEIGDGLRARPLRRQLRRGPESDLMACVPGERIKTTDFAGIADINYGSPTGLTAEGNDTRRPQKLKNDYFCTSRQRY